MKHKQLTFEQRYAIEHMLKEKHSKKSIITTLGLVESTFYRELKRNSKKRVYNAHHANMLAVERRKTGHYKTVFTSVMEKTIKDKLENNQWSPEQIVGWCKTKNINMVSHERIYQFVLKDKLAGGLLFKHLRTGQKIYKKRYGSKDRRGIIPNKVSIDDRPVIVQNKERAGDFEIDLIIGANHKGALLTIVDRKTSFVLIEPLKSKGAAEVTKAVYNALIPYKKWAQTITSDNGKEFALHEQIAAKLKLSYYFAHPYSSWERGLNEYTNKLIRQYFPKQMELDKVSIQDTLLVMNKLNSRPRKIYGFKTPNYLFSKYIYENKLAFSG
jgi:IS30 family transposase